MSDKSGANQPPKENAWVTLATNDTYALGAIVLARSLNQAGTKYAKCVMITDHVSKSMADLLKKAFESVVVVDLLDSADTYHLGLLARPELGVTFTKIHCWLRTEYGKCVFLDADTMVLERCDELFEREELSAAPDVGWPDCFNSGVFVFRPSAETFASIASFALHTQSFDGGDQGLLNLYFKNWSLEGPDKRLPFFYNMCSTACYSYIPAFKMYGGGAKIIHFIGPRKPWMFPVNPRTGVADPAEFPHLSEYIQRWWDLCINTVFPHLSPDMEHDVFVLYLHGKPDEEDSDSTDSATVKSKRATSTTLRSETSVGSITSFTLQSPPEFNLPFVDPWDAYLATNPTDLDSEGHEQNSHTESPQQTITNHCENSEHVDEFTNTSSVPKLEENTCRDSDWEDSKLSNIVLVDRSSPISYPYKNCNLNGNSETLQASIGASKVKEINKVDSSFKTSPKNVNLDAHTDISYKTSVDVPPMRATVPSSHSCTPEIPCCEQAVDTKVNAGDDSICLTNNETNKGGLPAKLATLTIGGRPAGGLEEHWRRTAWESSSADYMGRDSFDNVWEKIQSTLEEPSKVVPEAEQPGSAASSAEEPAAGKTLASGDSEKPVEAATPAEEPKGAPLADAPSAAVATPPLPSALVDVDSSSASSNLGSLAQTVSQAVAPSLSSLEPSLPPADSELDALTVDQVVTGEPSVALDVLDAGLLAAEVAPSPIPVESGLPEQSAVTTETSTPIPSQPDTILPEPLAETTEPAIPIPAVPDSIVPEPLAESTEPVSPISALSDIVPEPLAETTEPAIPISALSDIVPEPLAETTEPASPIPAVSDSVVPEPLAETTEPASPIPAVPDSIVPEPLAETLATEQPTASILSASDPLQTEPVAEAHDAEQPAIPLPAPSISSPLGLPAETHEIESAISAVPSEPDVVPRQEAVEATPEAEGEVQLEPGSVPSEPLPPQPVPRTPTVIEATPPTSPPIGQPGAFPLASSTPIPALVGAALSKERAETAPASQSDAEAAPIPPKRRGGPSKGGKSAVQKGKK